MGPIRAQQARQLAPDWSAVLSLVNRGKRNGRWANPQDKQRYFIKKLLIVRNKL
jgi:hypothetical protein